MMPRPPQKTHEKDSPSSSALNFDIAELVEGRSENKILTVIGKLVEVFRPGESTFALARRHKSVEDQLTHFTRRNDIDKEIVKKLFGSTRLKIEVPSSSSSARPTLKEAEEVRDDESWWYLRKELGQWRTAR